MNVKTKKYKLSPSLYIRIGLGNIFRKQWWVSLILLSAAGALYYFKYKISSIVAASLLPLYVLFWWIQFYSLTKIDDNKLMFERLFYEFSKDRLIIFLNTKQGMPIEWKQIAKVKQGKDYFLLFISTAQFIYLPHSIFQSEQQINLVRMLLQNKKLI